MRRVLILTALLSIIISSLNAALPEVQQRLTDDSFRGENTHFYTTGHSILSSKKGWDAFAGNPAALGSDQNFFNLDLSGGIYNLRNILTTPFVKNISYIMDQDTSVIIDETLGLLSTFSGRSPFIVLDESLSFGIKGFAVGVFLKERVLTTGESLGTNVILSLDWKASLGYAHRFAFSDTDYALSFGAILSYRGKMYTEDIGAEAVAAFALGADATSNYALFSGAALNLDLGVKAEFPYAFAIDMVLHDIGTPYYMNTLNDSSSRFCKEFDIETPTLLDTAISWSHDAGWISARLELGLEGVNRISSKETFLLSLHGGGDITLLKFLTLSAGLYKGYPAFGLKLRLFFISISLGYAAEDRGSSFGLRQGEQVIVNAAISF